MMIRQKLQENMDTEMGSDSLSRPAGGVPASLSEPLPRGRYALLRGQPIPSRSLTIILCDAFSGPVPVSMVFCAKACPSPVAFRYQAVSLSSDASAMQKNLLGIRIPNQTDFILLNIKSALQIMEKKAF